MITILFADDELHYLEGLIEAVKAEGYRVLTCRNASSAIEIVRSEKIDCLIIDIMMDPGPLLEGQDPQSAGIAAIDMIRRNNRNQSVICYSVISDQAVIRSLKDNNVLYLRKAETSAEVALKLIQSKATGVYRAK